MESLTNIGIGDLISSFKDFSYKCFIEVIQKSKRFISSLFYQTWYEILLGLGVVFLIHNIPMVMIPLSMLPLGIGLDPVLDLFLSILSIFIVEWLYLWFREIIVFLAAFRVAKIIHNVRLATISLIHSHRFVYKNYMWHFFPLTFIFTVFYTTVASMISPLHMIIMKTRPKIVFDINTEIL